MANDPSSDFYDTWYSTRIWRLLPAIYRTLDTTTTPTGADLEAGPLRELLNRVGTQAAVLRRAIDRLWENQSIETCDDWVIPYIGELLATRMVSCLDARAQRLDVAKTIYYRRRAGTLGLIEELATDIAGHDARAVEFFRRLGRTRHQFDPPIGDASANPAAWAPTTAYAAGQIVSNGANAYGCVTGGISSASGGPTGIGTDITDGGATWNYLGPVGSLVPAVIEGLAGPYSRTPAGGYADLRNAYGAANAGTAFDEFAYTADFRLGRQSTGWYNIPRLGVFVWWLYAFPVTNGTPVEWPACPGQFTFDPTGRDIQLFAPSSRAEEDFADDWVAPNEWELPVAVRDVLWNLLPDTLYPTAFSIALNGSVAPLGTFITDALTEIDPRRGRFRWPYAATSGGVATVSYCFGFSSAIGAGDFDPNVLTTPAPTPANLISLSGGSGLDAALGTITADTTVVFTDSATYVGPGTAPPLTPAAGTNIGLVANGGTRPVLRWTAPSSWTLTGNNGTLVLQGLWLQGGDLVLDGAWTAVTLQLCTLDPGTADPANPGTFLTAIDGVALGPTHIFVEGEVSQLTIERCVIGPIRTRQGGVIGALTVSDSIIQSIATHQPGKPGPIQDPADFAARLLVPTDPNAAAIRATLDAADLVALKAYTPNTPVALVGPLMTALQDVLAAGNPTTLEQDFPLALADLALGADSGDVALTRTTVLGPMRVHRLSASECILDDVATVDDPQDGCVRFSTLAVGHNLHAPYRCATVAPVGPIFETRLFGQPNYARLQADADQAILPGGPVKPVPSVVNGAQNGAEPGAFAGEAQALALRGLAQKLEEYAPIGLTPVFVDADL